MISPDAVWISLYLCGIGLAADWLFAARNLGTLILAFYLGLGAVVMLVITSVRWATE